MWRKYKEWLPDTSTGFKRLLVLLFVELLFMVVVLYVVAH